VAGPGDLFRLIRQGRLEWRAEVTSSELARVQPGSEVFVTAPGGAVARARVRMIGPTVDAQTRAGLVYVDLLGMREGEKPTLAAAFKPGMFAKGDFVVGNSSALTIPQQAVVVRDGFSYCFVVGTDGRVAQRKISVGRRSSAQDGGVVEVLSGLEPGAQVVASGAGSDLPGRVIWRGAVGPTCTGAWSFE
jgi:multidrug efflux pump subunit AcrA (membrane-fusion protein)